jgi:hypothetical protein
VGKEGGGEGVHNRRCSFLEGEWGLDRSLEDRIRLVFGQEESRDGGVAEYIE